MYPRDPLLVDQASYKIFLLDPAGTRTTAVLLRCSSQQAGAT